MVCNSRSDPNTGSHDLAQKLTYSILPRLITHHSHRLLHILMMFNYHYSHSSKSNQQLTAQIKSLYRDQVSYLDTKDLHATPCIQSLKMSSMSHRIIDLSHILSQTYANLEIRVSPHQVVHKGMYSCIINPTCLFITLITTYCFYHLWNALFLRVSCLRNDSELLWMWIPCFHWFI